MTNKNNFFGHMDVATIGGMAINNDDAKEGRIAHQVGEVNFRRGIKGSPGMSSRRTRRALESAKRKNRKVINFKV